MKCEKCGVEKADNGSCLTCFLGRKPTAFEKVFSEKMGEAFAKKSIVKKTFRLKAREKPIDWNAELAKLPRDQKGVE